jgi:hypothetical protein
MKTPEVLSADYEIQNPELKVYQKDNQYVIYTTATLKNKTTNDAFPQQFTFSVVKKEGNFVINQMTHFLGGIQVEESKK